MEVEVWTNRPQWWKLKLPNRAQWWKLKCELTDVCLRPHGIRNWTYQNPVSPVKSSKYTERQRYTHTHAWHTCMHTDTHIHTHTLHACYARMGETTIAYEVCFLSECSVHSTKHFICTIFEPYIWTGFVFKLSLHCVCVCVCVCVL